MAKPTGIVTISGSTLAQYQTLTASNTLADADGLGTITYHWQSSLDGTTWSQFATGNSVVLGQAQVGREVRAVATYTDGLGTAESVASGPLVADTATYSTGLGPNSVTTGDFNGDGKLDLAVANFASGTVTVRLGNGDGSFAAMSTVAAAGLSSPSSVVIGDFNDDGKADLAVSEYGSGALSVLLGNGDGTFAAKTAFATGSTGPIFVLASDLNGDGETDLAVAGISSNTVSVLLGNGHGSFAEPMTYSTGSFPYSIAVGDFNGDGKADLAVTNRNDNTVSVRLGYGDGSFAAPTDFATGNWPYSVAVGDFNGDGKADLATANMSSNTISVLLGNGNGGFAAQTSFATGSEPDNVIAGDFNGDGKIDLAVANSASNDLSILFGNGDGSFAAPTTHAVGYWPKSIIAGDFNGDSRPDLAVANYSLHTLSVLLGQGTTVANVNDPRTGSVTISGSPVQGKLLTAANTLADLDGLGTIHYQWKANGTAIAGATADTYTLTSGEVGKIITVTASYTDGYGTAESKTSAATQAVLNGVVTGTAGNDILMGTYGTNTLVGGAGNDTYYVNNSGDVVTEAANGGTDKVYSYLSAYTLGGNVEHGRIMSTGAASLTGNGLANTLTGNAAANTLSGASGNDTLDGGDGNDVLIGGAGNDKLTGGSGDDKLTGSGGSDKLTGGTGQDAFVFATTLDAATNVDTITDFSVADDTIKLENTGTGLFNALATGALAAGAFHSGAGMNAATQADDRIIYNTTTGALYYDADGTGATAAIQFAVVGTSNHPALTSADFLVI